MFCLVWRPQPYPGADCDEPHERMCAIGPEPQIGGDEKAIGLKRR
jgi:hypothetical protein